MTPFPAFPVVVSPGQLAFAPAPKTLRLEPGGFRFQVLGAPTTNPIVVYASSNLVNWLPLLTNPPVAGAATFLDVTAGRTSKRFYRAVQQP